MGLYLYDPYTYSQDKYYIPINIEILKPIQSIQSNPTFTLPLIKMYTISKKKTKIIYAPIPPFPPNPLLFTCTS